MTIRKARLVNSWRCVFVKGSIVEMPGTPVSPVGKDIAEIPVLFE